MRQNPPAQPDAGADGYAGAPEDDDAAEAPPEPDADGLVPIEHQGQTYAIPAALHGALTRHVRALDAHGQALQAGHQALQQAAEAHGANLADCARIVALGDQIAQMEGQNWGALHRANPAAAAQQLHQLFQMKQAHQLASSQLAHRQQVQAFDQQRQRALQTEQAQAELAQRLPGWSPQHAARLAGFALSQGLQPSEVQAINDPRLVMLLHHAWVGHQAGQAKAAGDTLAKTQAVRPAIQVGGGGSAPQDPNRMSTEDWIRHRRGQLRKKGR
ncbi:MAG TPA: hypothetical protein VMU59_14100 [Caulobacteraceae bacterium]|nr:hypothetical protein [Caulobacteraceae bacterium]